LAWLGLIRIGLTHRFSVAPSASLLTSLPQPPPRPPPSFCPSPTTPHPHAHPDAQAGGVLAQGLRRVHLGEGPQAGRPSSRGRSRGLPAGDRGSVTRRTLGAVPGGVRGAAAEGAPCHTLTTAPLTAPLTRWACARNMDQVWPFPACTEVCRSARRGRA